MSFYKENDNDINMKIYRPSVQIKCNTSVNKLLSWVTNVSTLVK